MQTKVASGKVTASISYKERTLTGILFGSTAGYKGASFSGEASTSERESGLHGSTVPTAPSSSALLDKSDSVDSTPAPKFDVHAMIADQPNRWCVDGQF